MNPTAAPQTESLIKAVVFRKAARSLKVESLPKPVPGSEGVLVRVSYASVCGSDLFLIQSGQLPDGTILGHEMSGTVEAVGERVQHLRPGQPVIVRPMGCGTCGPCTRGEENLCPRRLAIGLGALPGAFAQHLVVPQGMIIPVPEGLDLKIASLAEPLATALHAVRVSQIDTQERVVVLGAGGIGLCCVAILRALGVRNILVSEPNRGRRKRAEQLGASVVDPEAQDLRGAVEGWTKGAEITSVIECAGKTQTLMEALAVVSPGGKVVIVGLVKGTVEWVPSLTMLKQIRIQGSFANTQAECRECLELLAEGKLNVEPIIERVIPLGELPECIERLLESPSDGKVIVDMTRL